MLCISVVGITSLFLCVHYKGDEWNNMIHACMILPRNAMSKPNGQHLYYSIITTSAYLIIQWVQQHLISERSELNNFLKLFFHVKKIANFSYCALILMGKVQNCVSISKGFDNKFWDEKNLSPWLILKSFSIWLKGMKHESFRVLAPQNELPPPKMPQDLPQQLEISFGDEWCSLVFHRKRSLKGKNVDFSSSGR